MSFEPTRQRRNAVSTPPRPGPCAGVSASCLIASDRTTAFRLFLFFLCLFGFTAGGHFYSGDGATMYMVARNLVERGTITLEQDIYVDRGVDGRYYPKSGLGQPLALAPLFAAGAAIRHAMGARGDTIPAFTVSLFNVPVTAIAAVIVFVIGRLLGWQRARAAALSLVFGTATLAWPYSGYCFNHPLAGVCLLGAVACALRFRATGAASAMLGCSACLAYGVFTRHPLLVAVPIVLVYAFGCRPSAWPRNARVWGAATAPLLAVGAFLLAFNYVRFHRLFQFGYAGEGFTTPVWQGLGILLAHPAKSLFFFNPPVVLGLVGFWAFSRRRPREAGLFGALIVTWLLFHAAWHSPEGGLSWGPRMLLEIIPFALLPAGVLLDRRAGRAALRVLWGAGCLVQIPGALAFYKDSLPNGPLDASMFMGNVRQVLAGKLDSTWTRHLGPAGAVFSILVLGVLLWLVRRSLRGGEPPAGSPEGTGG